MTTLTIKTIKIFTTRAGQKIEGEVMEDIGHAMAIRVTKGRKNYVGRTMLFAKNDMCNCITREYSTSSHTLKLSEILGA